MACCFRVKAESPTHNGLNSKVVGKEEDVEILQSNNNLKCFTINELKTATRNFHLDGLIGEGGFGSVFKGWIDDEHKLAPTKPDTGLVIAVKRLNQKSAGYESSSTVEEVPLSSTLEGADSQWLDEINYLGQLHHPNLVKLIGYCLEDDHQILVYEFLTKGSLDNHLFRIEASNFEPLSWKIRMKIALDAAKALAFLHSNEIGVIYGDFKASKILIDSNYNAKLSIFGLEKEIPEDDEIDLEMLCMDTTIYKAEIVDRGQLTKKSDVYKFGVVLLEIMSGKRAFDKNRPYREQNLVGWAKPLLIQKHKISKVMDYHIEGQYSPNEAMKVGYIVYKCLTYIPKYRPNMDEVVRLLELLQDSKDTVGGVDNPQSLHQTTNHTNVDPAHVQYVHAVVES